jgi:hypothetical protein
MRNMTWLHMSYWVPAIGDFVLAIFALIPQLSGVERLGYHQVFFAATAVSWGIMLIVADRQPLERKWVLIPTLLIVALLGATSLLSLLAGMMTVRFGLSLVVTTGLMCLLIVFSYRTSGQLVRL